MKLRRSFFARGVHDVAPELVGATFLVEGTGGKIVEVEAYHHEDPAAHSFGGQTARNATMFGPPGHTYVYRSYGIHWCVNFVCEEGSAVLLRALELTHGLEVMAERRGTTEARLLAAGPGRLAQALGLTGEHDGLPLDRPPFELYAAEDVEIAVGPRIGITKAAELPWRYAEAGSKFLSRPIKPLRRS